MNIKNIFRKTEEKSLPLQPVGNMEFFNQPQYTSRAMSSSEALNQYKGLVYSCVRIISESVAATPYALYTGTNGDTSVKNFKTRSVNPVIKKKFDYISKAKSNDNWVEITEHPLINLLDEVNNHSNYFDLLYLAQVYLELTGNAYWYIAKDRYGIPESIHQLRPDCVKIITDEKEFIKGYMYINGMNRIAFGPDEIIRFSTPNPASPYYGLGTIAAAIPEVERIDLYNTYANSSLKNNARPDFIVKYNGQLDPAQMSKLTKEWNRLYSGASMSNKIKIMDSNFTIDTLSFNAKDMEYLEGRKLTTREICMIFGVPMGLLDTTDQLKAGIDNIMPIFIKLTLMPKLRRIQEILNEFLVPMYDDNLWLVFDNPDQVETIKQHDSAIKLFQAGLISQEEARVMAGIDI